MKVYHQISKNEIKKAFSVLDDLSRKFPMLKLSDVNIASLSEYYKIKTKDIICAYLFIHFLKENGAYVSVDDIHSIKVKRNGEDWKFIIKSMLTKNEHTFDFTYSL